MIDYQVDFSVDGDIDSIYFSDSFDSDEPRKLYAKMWIKQYLQVKFRDVKKKYVLIDIKKT